jgi:hypothetical protein
MNTVLNFAYFDFQPRWGSLRSLVVPSDLPAATAAELAEQNEFDVLVVQDASGKTVGGFFPDYLREHLPVNPRVGQHLAADQSLRDMIAAVDAVMPDFHSEDVNTNPSLGVCPAGPHVTAFNPCRKHGIPTTPY